jgi:ankyrin repeat protein
VVGGFWPFHAGALNGNDELCALLVERGADESAATDDGRTVADFRQQQ